MIIKVKLKSKRYIKRLGDRQLYVGSTRWMLSAIAIADHVGYRMVAAEQSSTSNWGLTNRSYYVPKQLIGKVKRYP